MGRKKQEASKAVYNALNQLMLTKDPYEVKLAAETPFDIHDKLNSDYYKNKMEYPKSVEYQCIECGMKLKKLDRFCSDCGATTNFAAKDIEYNQKIKQYHEEDGRLYGEFQEDAFKDLGIFGNPRAEKAWSIAWERGHAYGFYDVFSILQDLAELIK